MSNMIRRALKGQTARFQNLLLATRIQEPIAHNNHPVGCITKRDIYSLSTIQSISKNIPSKKLNYYYDQIHNYRLMTTTTQQSDESKQTINGTTQALNDNPVSTKSAIKTLLEKGYKIQRQQRVNGGSTKKIKRAARKPSITILTEQQPQQQQQQAAAEVKVKQASPVVYPVQAMHIATSINIYSLLSSAKAFDPTNNSVLRKQMFGSNSVVVELRSSRAGAISAVNGKETKNQNQPAVSGSNGKNSKSYVVVFEFGSVVFFNVSPRMVGPLLTNFKKHAIEPISSGFERKDYFGVVVDPEKVDSYVTGDYCVVPQLDINCAAVISNIMAQTVALDTYNETVDGLLHNFAKINSAVAKTGNIPSSEKEILFKSIGQNNSIFIDMISKVRIKDRSDTAWNLSKFDTIHDGMKEEFEIEDRFEHIDFKLNLIQNNAKLFLDVLQNQKSTSLEWIIVVLIGFECVIMILEMSGMGPTVFENITKMI